MQAVVNQPHTQNTEAAYFRIEGKVPKFVIMFLESAFKDSLKIEKKMKLKMTKNLYALKIGTGTKKSLRP